MKQKDILLLIVPMFVFTVIWILFSIYHNFATTTISKGLNKNITPISPDFDLTIIESLKAREKISPIFEFKAESKGEASPSGLVKEESNLP